MATRALLSQDSHGTLPLGEDTCQALSDKHPPAEETTAEALFRGSFDPPPSEISDRTTADGIRSHALHTHGAAGQPGRGEEERLKPR